jgi:hypothetical protein
MKVVWTEYLKHRALTRGFELAAIEHIVRSSEERYFDTASTGVASSWCRTIVRMTP